MGATWIFSANQNPHYSPRVDSAANSACSTAGVADEVVTAGVVVEVGIVDVVGALSELKKK